VKQAITFWLQTPDTSFSYDWIQASVPRWDKCLNVNGTYAQVWRVWPIMHMIPRRKFSAWQCVSSYFLKLTCTF